MTHNIGIAHYCVYLLYTPNISISMFSTLAVYHKNVRGRHVRYRSSLKVRILRCLLLRESLKYLTYAVNLIALLGGIRFTSVDDVPPADNCIQKRSVALPRGGEGGRRPLMRLPRPTMVLNRDRRHSPPLQNEQIIRISCTAKKPSEKRREIKKDHPSFEAFSLSNLNKVL